MYGPGDPGFIDPSEIPLGSYPETTSPWGLLDTSGGFAEWTPEVDPFSDSPFLRMLGGTTGHFGNPEQDTVTGALHLRAVIATGGLRLASAVPSAGAVTVGVFGCVFFGRARWR
jgi:hypothetical protein